ncbi:MAG TPA: DNA polymerase III subunit [Atribacteraceae bacterium]|nr:DNA polymerase III subunit [Atribacteraceae bacterium]
MAWRDVCGHDFPKLFIGKLLTSGRLGHAFLFSGPSGCGKTTFALETASFFNCSKRGSEGACGGCMACLLIKAGTHPDVMRVTPKDGYLRIDDVRSFIHWMSLQRMLSPYRFGILSGVELMTEEAANCILKSLEEPPPASLILMITTRPENLLPTLLSRCRQIVFSYPSSEEINKYLSDIKGVASHTAEILSREAAGKIGDALKLQEAFQSMKESFLEIKSDLLSILDAEGDKTLKEIEESIREIDQIVMQGNPFGLERESGQKALHNILKWQESLPINKQTVSRKNAMHRLSELIEQVKPIKYRMIEFWRKLIGTDHVLTFGKWLRGQREKDVSLPDWVLGELVPLLSCLESYTRDVILYRLLGPDSHQSLCFPDLESELAQDAERFDLSTLTTLIAQIESYTERLSDNPQLDIQSIHFLLSVRTLLSSENWTDTDKNLLE